MKSKFLDYLKNSYVSRKILAQFSNNWRNLENKHKGESCYIFGNGPSIKWFDFENFKDKISISTGKLHYHKEFSSLNIKYLSLVEPWFFTDSVSRKLLPVSEKQSKIIREHKNIAEDYKNLIKNSKDKTFFINLSNFFHLREENICYIYRNFPLNSKSVDCRLKNYDVFSGSFYAPLSLAHYLGFAKVYMVGFDAWTLKPSMNKRYYEFGPGTPSGVDPQTNELINIFKDNLDISVISHNASSPVLKNIDYEQYFGVKAIYRENHEIIEEHYLNMLSNCPGYEI